MTILNVHVRPDRVLIGMDTIVFHTGGAPPIETSKFGVVPQANVVVAWRGERMLHANIFLECFAAAVPVDLDFLVETLPAKIPGRIDAVRQSFADQGAPPEMLRDDSLGTVEMVLAGWSRATGSMAAVRLALRPGDESIGVHPIAEAIISQGDFLERSEVIVPSSVGAMEKLARSQFAAVQRHGVAEQGFGGHFLIVELERRDLRIRSRPIFPNALPDPF